MTASRENLNVERRECVKDLLLDALEHPAEERENFVFASCDAPGVCREVLSLLRREETAPAADRLLRQDAFELRSEPADGVLQTGQRVGPYEVVRPLGAGGMGTVALAVRTDDFEKEVALKLVRPGVLSGELVRRFDNERQILARLEHPYVARILDGGTAEDGRPYFVMEHVDGLPIDTYCEENGLGVHECVALVLKVCEALQAAHQSLVVHRDLKPSNVLVTRHGTPKLLDFGIAKALDDVSGVTRITRMGGQGPMTLRYASPEQVEGEAITTASDVYSLAVLFYELLAGRSPYPEDADSDLALARAIVGGEPPPPSVHRTLNKDLDAIVRKALRREPSERYGSAEQMAADLRCFLDGRPVLARQGDWTYRTAKLLRRHKVAFGAAAIFSAVVLTFSVVTTILWQRAEHVQDRAERTVVYLRSLFLESDPDVAEGKELTAREFLHRGLGKIDELNDDPLLQADLLYDLGSVNLTLGFWETARDAREKELAALRRAHEEPHKEIARALNNLGAVHFRMGEGDLAEHYYREAIAMGEALGDDVETKRINLAGVLLRRGSFDEAETIYLDVLQKRERRHGNDHRLVTNSLLHLGTALYVRGDVDRAEPLLRRAWEVRRQLFGDTDSKTLSALSGLGRVLHAQEKWQESEDALTRVLDRRVERLPSTHPHVARSRRDLASLYLDLGEDATAAVLLGQAQRVLRQTQGNDSWEVAEIESLVGVLLNAEGRRAAARTCLVESLSTLVRTRGEASLYTLNARRRLDYLGSPLDPPLDDSGRTGAVPSVKPSGSGSSSFGSSPVEPPRGVNSISSTETDSSVSPDGSPKTLFNSRARTTA